MKDSDLSVNLHLEYCVYCGMLMNVTEDNVSPSHSKKIGRIPTSVPK